MKEERKHQNQNIVSPLPKPDFSSIEKKENSLSFHTKGSYKKKKSYVPESPVKKNQKYFTPHKPMNVPVNPNASSHVSQRLFFGTVDNCLTKNDNTFSNLVKNNASKKLDFTSSNFKNSENTPQQTYNFNSLNNGNTNMFNNHHHTYNYKNLGYDEFQMLRNQDRVYNTYQQPTSFSIYDSGYSDIKGNLNSQQENVFSALSNKDQNINLNLTNHLNQNFLSQQNQQNPSFNVDNFKLNSRFSLNSPNDTPWKINNKDSTNNQHSSNLQNIVFGQNNTQNDLTTGVNSNNTAHFNNLSSTFDRLHNNGNGIKNITAFNNLAKKFSFSNVNLDTNTNMSNKMNEDHHLSPENHLYNNTYLSPHKENKEVKNDYQDNFSNDITCTPPKKDSSSRKKSFFNDSSKHSHYSSIQDRTPLNNRKRSNFSSSNKDVKEDNSFKMHLQYDNDLGIDNKQSSTLSFKNINNNMVNNISNVDTECHSNIKNPYNNNISSFSSYCNNNTSLQGFSGNDAYSLNITNNHSSKKVIIFR